MITVLLQLSSYKLRNAKAKYLMPNSLNWVVIVIIIGGLTTWIASKGYDMVSKAAN